MPYQSLWISHISLFRFAIADLEPSPPVENRQSGWIPRFFSKAQKEKDYEDHPQNNASNISVGVKPMVGFHLLAVLCVRAAQR